MAVTAANVRYLEGAILRAKTAGGTVDAGEPVYIDSNSKVQAGDANTAAAAQVMGVIVAGSDPGETTFELNDAVTVCVFGPVGGFSGLTPGATQYIGETEGAIVETAPSGAGTWTQVIGYAESDTILFVNPGVSAAASNS